MKTYHLLTALLALCAIPASFFGPWPLTLAVTAAFAASTLLLLRRNAAEQPSKLAAPDDDCAALHRRVEELSRQREELAESKLALERELDAITVAETEKGLLENKLRRSQTLEAVGRLAGGVAHEFNNLLGSILGCLYPLKQATASAPDARQQVDRISELCARGGELTRQLIAFGRRSVAQAGPVNMEELAESLNIITRRTLSRAVTYTSRVEPGLPAVVGNRSDLLTALLNIVLNARDAMPGGGKLDITWRQESGNSDATGYVVVEITDSGVGISDESKDHIFEPFFSTKGQDEASGSGTGLGLSTAYAAITEAGGTITVESQKGAGATFVVRLPARQAGVEAADATPDSAAGVGAILVVDADEEARSQVSSALTERGYSVFETGNGLDALGLLRDKREQIAAVLLDVELPGVGGREIRRYLRLFAPEVRVLYVTDREELLDENDLDTQRLAKPFEGDALLGALDRLFAN